ncbi:MAG: hypothetical protein U1E76_21895 [Planctomycetota bacterium]
MQAPAGSPSTAIDKARRFWASRALLGLLVTAGALLRIRQYVNNPAFFAEEGSLALNVVRHDWLELLQPLDYAQGAPPLFLWLARLLTLSVGHAEYVLRLVPALTSVLALPLFAACARNLIGERAAPVAVGLLAFCDPVIEYATVFKQYSSDVAVSAALLYLASCRRPVSLIAGGAMAMWLSHPAPIMLTGVGAMLLSQALRPPSAARMRTVAVAFLVWLVSALVLYVVHVRYVGDNEVFKVYWTLGWAPFPPIGAQDWRWYAHSFADLLRQCGLAALPAALVLIAGVVALVVSRRSRVAVLSLPPLLTAYVLAAAKVYPFADRMILFLVPCVALLVGAGALVPIDLLRRWPMRRTLTWRLAPVVLIALQIAIVPALFAASLPASIALWRHPYRRSDLREITARLRELRNQGDLVCAGTRAWAPYEYYNLGDREAPPWVLATPGKISRELRVRRPTPVTAAVPHPDRRRPRPSGSPR